MPFKSGLQNPVKMEDKDEKTDELINNDDTIPSQSFLFFMLGMCSTLGYFIFINGSDIFVKVFDDNKVVSSISRSFYFVYFVCHMFLGLFNYFVIPTFLIKFGLFGLILVIPCICITTYYASKSVKWILLILVGICGGLSSMITNGSRWVLEQFENHENKYYLIGMSCCGIFASGLRLFIKSSSHNSEKSDSGIYFGFSCFAYLLTTAILYFKLMIQEIKERFDVKKQDYMIYSREYWDLFKDTYKSYIFIFINYCLTFAIFPGYIIQIRNYENYGNWVKTISIVIFCVFDFLGGELVKKIHLPEKISQILVLTRFLFLPIFIISIQGIVYLGDPFWGFFWVIPFGLSNSYLGGNLSLFISLDPNHSRNSKKKVINLIFMVRIFGIFIGTCLTFLFDSIK